VYSSYSACQFRACLFVVRISADLPASRTANFIPVGCNLACSLRLCGSILPAIPVIESLGALVPNGKLSVRGLLNFATNYYLTFIRYSGDSINTRSRFYALFLY